MTKTDKEYDRLFETLMTYTEFTSVDKIEKTEDLHTFFNDIKHNAQAKGRKNPVSRNLKEEMIKAYGRLLRKPIHHKIHTEKETATTTKPHKRFQTAKEQKLTFVYNKQEIYKTIIHRGKKHKPITVYRNSKGRFVLYKV